MIDPPFLELAYYMTAELDAQILRALVPDFGSKVVTEKMAVAGAVGLTNKPEEVERSGDVVVFRSEGEAFCGPMRSNRARLKRLGRKVYERFIFIADSLDCKYGAILVEYTLENPAELTVVSKSLAFQDFFVSREALGDIGLQEVARLAGADAYTESTVRGVYVSMTPEFNPAGQGLLNRSRASWRSVDIGKYIGKVLREH